MSPRTAVREYARVIRKVRRRTDSSRGKLGEAGRVPWTDFLKTFWKILTCR